MPPALGRKTYARIPVVLPLPNLIEIQLDSFKWFISRGLLELLDEISPIESYNGGIKIYFPGRSPEATEWGLELWFGDIKYTQEECLDRDLTYSSPLYVKVLMIGEDVPEPITADIFMGDFPIMTEKGTFIINGTERVVVSQLIRSPGVYFNMEEDRTSGRRLSTAKLIPDRGAWMEFETRKSDYITVKFNRKRTVPVTMLLRALAAVDDGTPNRPLTKGTDEELMAVFADVDTSLERQYIAATIRQEPDWEPTSRRTVAEVALVEFYKRMRPGDPPTLDNAREYIKQQLFDQRRYYTEQVGRYKLNQTLEMGDLVPLDYCVLTQHDLIHLIKRMITINNAERDPDDVDHLGNRRVKTVGELIQAKMRVGLRRTERVIRERMSIRGEQETLSPVNLINIRPIVASVREFFGSSQLSQFMDQTNPLAELRHKRTISALGPGGLRRERAGFDVRDVHHSHYGRICPIETPEGPNIGLIGRLASYAKVNSFGFIETPYRRVVKSLGARDKNLIGRVSRLDIKHPKSGDLIVSKGEKITKEHFAKIKKLSKKTSVEIRPYVSDQIDYLSADLEDHYVIAQGNTPLDENNEFVSQRPSCRAKSKFLFAEHHLIDYMDVAPRQIVGISAALIPFLEHDDANRALMGSNMMSQAVPLLIPEVPRVATGMEVHAARDSGQVVITEHGGEVTNVTGSEITIADSEGDYHTYQLRKFERSNQSTSIDQRPIVSKGLQVEVGQVIADSSSTENGELALGQNVLVAFMSWEGGNFEDAILISERLIRDDKFTSIHIEKHEVEARDTKLGPEEITFDIPNVGEDALKDLDERGIIRIGAKVGPNDVLVGKITPKGEKELTPEEKLLRAIFGEKAREVKDTSLRMPHGQKGKVVDVRVFSREDYRDLQAGVEQMVRVSVAERRKLTEGDKMAGRHGNKGVISKIVPVEDMPYLEDGTPIDIILSPLGVPGRMNIGQIFETHLGWAAERLGFRAITPVFDGAHEDEIEAELARAWLIDQAWHEVQEQAWEALYAQDYDPEIIEDDVQAMRLYLESWLGDRFDPDLIATDMIYARRITLKAWLETLGYTPADLLAFDDETLSIEVRASRDRRATQVCLREWLRVQGVEAESDDIDQLRVQADQVMQETGQVLPLLGKMKLFDGFTGEAYDHPVTVGIIHMLKLHHLVEDKVHARSTGPYSLVTQQPLGGKAQFGGQRFGEMEVWALEAYGAAYMLQEMLTVKSDDVQGRVKTYESIVKGEPIEAPGIPASFRVLVKELQSLGLAVEAVAESGEIIKFGKDEEKQRAPRLGGLGLLGFASAKQNSGR